jgi:hypothetical protein
MPSPQPPNGEEASYAAIALFDALAELLLAKQVIGDSELFGIMDVAAKRLRVAPNHASNRAADFILAWMASKKEVE